jgi:hypothetical protein
VTVLGVRSSFYGSPIYPTAFFDGTDEVFEQDPNAFITTYNAHIYAAKANTPIYYFELTAAATTITGDVQVTIATTDTMPEGQMFAFVAICQDSVRGILKDFNYVCQELYSFPLDLVAIPDTLDTVYFDTTITFNHAMPIDKMRAVVFVQNMDTKEIMHSATKQFEEVQ